MRLRIILELLAAVLLTTVILGAILSMPSFLGVDFHNLGMTIVIILIAYLVGDLLSFRFARGGGSIFLNPWSNKIMKDWGAYLVYFVIIVVLSIITEAASVYVGGLLNSMTNGIWTNLELSFGFSLAVLGDLRLRYYPNRN